jgi:hypothetical protein
MKSKLVISLAASLIAFLMRFLKLTNKWSWLNSERLEIAKTQPVIFAFWHGRLLMIPPFRPKGAKINVLISHHSDGALIARVQSKFGIGTIRGSTSKDGKNKGGLVAIREIMRAIKNNECLAITPDGPRGPARKVSGNIVEIAKKLELPIIPVTYSCTKFWQLKTWDGFVIPKPFGKGVFAIGEVIPFERAEELEEEMNKLTLEADFAVKNL